MDKLDQPGPAKKRLKNEIGQSYVTTRPEEDDDEPEDLDSDDLDEIDYGDDDDDYENDYNSQQQQQQQQLQQQQQKSQEQQQQQQQQKQQQQQQQHQQQQQRKGQNSQDLRAKLGNNSQRLDGVEYGRENDDEDEDDDDDDDSEQDGASSDREDGDHKTGSVKERRRLGRVARKQQEQEDSEQGKDGDKSTTTAERCKYWPACNAGDSCSYYHPTKPCRNFPNCSFGDKCLYIHPPCKFNQSCARPNCPFAHPAVLTSAVKRRPAPPPVQQFRPALQHHQVAAAGAPKCKFGVKCTNVMCKFSHQSNEPCRYGANCLLETCAYTHPADAERNNKKKPASQFKWSAQD